MKIFLITLCVCLSVAAQTESFEKRAISAAQRIPASNLDAKLPNRSFATWLSGLVGKDAGVVWQLAECGAGGTGQDTMACAEATVLLPNGDTVIVGISIGTFKLGLIGDPAFQGAVIKTDERILQVRRLSDLPGMLPPLNGVSRQPLLRADLGRESKGMSRSSSVDLNMPDLQSDPSQVVMRPFPSPPLAALDHDIDVSAPKFSALYEDGAPPAPPARSSQSSGKLVDASILTKGRPVYPPAAKAMGIAGKVEVRVVISESGKVVDATPISGHAMLRSAAVAAARQWVYKPATLNGLPVRTESILTIAFGDQ